MIDAGRADLWRESFVMIMILPAEVRSEEDGEIPMRQKKAVFCCYSHRMIYFVFFICLRSVSGVQGALLWF